jgi:hypothetical protein
VDSLSSSLEYLCIRDYKRHATSRLGDMLRQHAGWDEQVDALIAAIEEGRFPHLKEVTGVDRKIPSSIHAIHQDLYATIWSLSENGHETDGTAEARERGDVDYATGEKAFFKHMK